MAVFCGAGGAAAAAAAVASASQTAYAASSSSCGQSSSTPRRLVRSITRTADCSRPSAVGLPSLAIVPSPEGCTASKGRTLDCDLRGCGDGREGVYGGNDPRRIFRTISAPSVARCSPRVVCQAAHAQNASTTNNAFRGFTARLAEWQDQRSSSSLSSAAVKVETPVTPASASEATKVSLRLHLVMPGETLYSICNRYELPPDAIMQLNNKSSQQVYVGEVLYLPHPVALGDSAMGVVVGEAGGKEAVIQLSPSAKLTVRSVHGSSEHPRGPGSSRISSSSRVGAAEDNPLAGGSYESVSTPDAAKELAAVVNAAAIAAASKSAGANGSSVAGSIDQGVGSMRALKGLFASVQAASPVSSGWMLLDSSMRSAGNSGATVAGGPLPWHAVLFAALIVATSAATAQACVSSAVRSCSRLLFPPFLGLGKDGSKGKTSEGGTPAGAAVAQRVVRRYVEEAKGRRSSSDAEDVKKGERGGSGIRRLGIPDGASVLLNGSARASRTRARDLVVGLREKDKILSHGAMHDRRPHAGSHGDILPSISVPTRLSTARQRGDKKKGGSLQEAAHQMENNAATLESEVWAPLRASSGQMDTEAMNMDPMAHIRLRAAAALAYSREVRPGRLEKVAAQRRQKTEQAPFCEWSVGMARAANLRAILHGEGEGEEGDERSEVGGLGERLQRL